MSNDFDQLMDKAGARHAAGDLAGAAEIYAGLLAREPGNEIVRFFNALAVFDLGQRTEAIDTLYDLVQRLPDIPKIRMDLGQMLEREGRYGEAADVFAAAAAQVPGDPAPHIMLGHMLSQTGDNAQAIAAYRKGLSIQPAIPEARTALARALMLEGLWAEADVECDRVLAAQPGHTGVMAMKSILYYETGRPDDARAIMNFDDRLMLRSIVDHCGAEGLADFNAALSEAITTHPTIAYEPKDYSTRKGYHTGDLTDATSGPIFEYLTWLRGEIDKVIAACRASRSDPFECRAPESYTLNVWGVVMENQGHQAAHIHRDAWLSGVYYPKVPADVRADDPDHAGWIEFGTPYEYPKRKTVSDIKLIMPEVGRAIFFPSYFYHRTIPLNATETRISTAFDVIPA